MADRKLWFGYYAKVEGTIADEFVVDETEFEDFLAQYKARSRDEWQSQNPTDAELREEAVEAFIEEWLRKNHGADTVPNWLDIDLTTDEEFTTAVVDEDKENQ